VKARDYCFDAMLIGLARRPNIDVTEAIQALLATHNAATIKALHAFPGQVLIARLSQTTLVGN